MTSWEQRVIERAARIKAREIVAPGMSAQREQRVSDEKREAPADWRAWNKELFPGYVREEYATWHEEVHEWADAIESPTAVVRPMVAVAARGGGKSSTAELVCTRLGVTNRRKYGWYVRETQPQADDSVSNVGAMLESDKIAEYYPEHAQRRVGKFGQSKGWRRNRLRTKGGFTVDALGLDTAARGFKIEEDRPDFIIIDDIDGKHDSPQATLKKIEILTHTILPAGTPWVAVLAIQNLIIPHGVFTRLATGRADFLIRRKVTGPHPALIGMETKSEHDKVLDRPRAVIVKGRPTWKGQDVAACQALMDIIGLRAFRQECQHEVHEREGALWKAQMIPHVDKPPRLIRIGVGVDPSGGGDEIGIIAAGEGIDGNFYVIRDVSQLGSLGALNWGRVTVRTYDDLQADFILGESNFGGNLVESNIKVAAGRTASGGQREVPVELVHASRGKDVRAEPVAALYEDGKVFHVGYFPELEQEMTTWVKRDGWSPNRLDGLVWVMTKLALVEVVEEGYELVWR